MFKNSALEDSNGVSLIAVSNDVYERYLRTPDFLSSTPSIPIVSGVARNLSWGVHLDIFD